MQATKCRVEVWKCEKTFSGSSCNSQRSDVGSIPIARFSYLVDSVAIPNSLKSGRIKSWNWKTKRKASAWLCSATDGGFVRRDQQSRRRW